MLSTTAPLLDIEQVPNCKLLGMIISSSLSVRDHVDYVCNQRLYLLNKLKHAGLNKQGLATVFQAIVVSRVLYALPAWFGRLTQLDIGRINGLFRKAHQWELAGRVYTVEQLAGTADAGIFRATASNPNHSLYQILPPLDQIGIHCANVDVLFSFS